MILTFGEIMMRVSPPGFLRFRQALPGHADITFSGAEANVAAFLALQDKPVRFLTALPDNAITECVLASLHSVGIRTDAILLRSAGRLGTYFLETGANQRGSLVVYDRTGSAISLARPDEYHFERALDGVRWVHVTGITPALSREAFMSTRTLIRRAQKLGISASCDLNFRKKLWRWRAGVEPRDLARECMSEILPSVDLVIANEEDAADVLGIQAADTSVETGQINAAAYEQVARTIVDQFPNVSRVAITLRESISASHNNWGGMLYDRRTDAVHFAPLDDDGAYQPYEIRNIVDRVGAGDSFAGGLIYALTSRELAAPANALRFAVAASCLKHSITGDFCFAGKEEVRALMQGRGSGRVRR
jgi:2-dehydro-3-deoxygluconokinase